MGLIKMRYVGYIHRLYTMILAKEDLTKDQVVNKIYNIMARSDEIEEITKEEIKEVLEKRIGL